MPNFISFVQSNKPIAITHQIISLGVNAVSRANPLGIGAGNWWIVFPKFAFSTTYAPSFIDNIYRFPHNDFLWIWAETGIGGILCYLGIFATGLYYAIKSKSTWLIIAIAGYMVVAFFSAPRERAFSSLMMITFIAMACPRNLKIKKPQILLSVLIFTLVVFGFRFRASCWDKKLRRSKTNVQYLENSQGYSIFSTLDYCGLPWHWWRGVTNQEIGNYKLAKRQFEKAYKLNPYSPYTLNGMGIAKEIEGNKELAFWYYNESLRICPQFVYASRNLARMQ